MSAIAGDGRHRRAARLAPRHRGAPAGGIAEVAAARMAAVSSIDGRHRSSLARPVQAHRRQGRLVAAGRSRARRGQARLARGARRRSRGACIAPAPTCSSSPRARSRLGRTVLGLPNGALKLEDSQAAAAVGQIALAAHLGRGAGRARHDGRADPGHLRRYRRAPPLSQCARDASARLLRLRAVPVINENDTVATSEIRYGDNDRLAARVATMASRRSADPAVRHRRALSTPPPAQIPTRELIPVVPRITAEIEAHGRRRRLGTVARRHARPRSRRRRSPRPAAPIWSSPTAASPIRSARIGAGRALHLVPDAARRRSRRARNGSPARSSRAGAVHRRRRRGARDRRRRQPAAGRRQAASKAISRAAIAC